MALSLKFYPDKPYEHSPKDLDKWDRKGDYICQQKVDGWRMIIILTEDGPEFLSRHNKCFTEEIWKDAADKNTDLREQASRLLEVFPVGTQIDCEWLGRRSCSVTYKAKPKLILFDLLRHGRRWLNMETYEARWEMLKEGMAELDLSNVLLSIEAEPGTFATFYKEQKTIAISEGVVLKHKRSKMMGARNGCKKNPRWYKVKYRGGSSGEMSMDHLRSPNSQQPHG